VPVEVTRAVRPAGCECGVTSLYVCKELGAIQLAEGIGLQDVRLTSPDDRRLARLGRKQLPYPADVALHDGGCAERFLVGPEDFKQLVNSDSVVTSKSEEPKNNPLASRSEFDALARALG
jgi:hypothetical protein